MVCCVREALVNAVVSGCVYGGCWDEADARIWGVSRSGANSSSSGGLVAVLFQREGVSEAEMGCSREVRCI